jgi:hypothetical protein
MRKRSVGIPCELLHVSQTGENRFEAPVCLDGHCPEHLGHGEIGSPIASEEAVCLVKQKQNAPGWVLRKPLQDLRTKRRSRILAALRWIDRHIGFDQSLGELAPQLIRGLRKSDLSYAKVAGDYVRTTVGITLNLPQHSRFAKLTPPIQELSKLTVNCLHGSKLAPTSKKHLWSGCPSVCPGAAISEG